MEKEKSKAKSKTLSLENDLMSVLKFTQDDLDSNRNGLLSEKQQQKFAEDYNALTISTVIAGLVGGVLLPLMIYLIDHNSPAGDGSILVVFVILVLAGAVYAWWKKGAVGADLNGKQVEAIQGRIKLSVTGGSKGSNFKITLGDQSWTVENNIFLAFKNGDPYCLYYAPHSKTLLSAEWLRED